MIIPSVPQSVWRNLAEKFWLASLAAGIFLIIVGATGAAPFTPQPIANVYLQIIVLAGGVALIGFSIYAGLAATEPPINGHPSQPGPPKINPRAHNVLITSPRAAGETVPPIMIQGTVKKGLGELELWLVSVGEISGAPAYWPQRQVYPDHKNKWSVTYTPKSFRDGERRRLRLYLVGKDGQALLSAYNRINEQFAGEKLPWVGLTKITSDIVPACNALQVILKHPSDTADQPKQ